jgi:hypothetical protein
MCHGQYHTGKTIRYKAADGKHKDAKPYRRPKSRKWDDDDEN